MSARLVRAAREVVEAVDRQFLGTPKDVFDAVAALKSALPRKRGARTARKAERSMKRASRNIRMAQIRETVMSRAQGHCEVCATGRAEEAHHLISGPLRRVRESVLTVIALCGSCHRGIHAGNLDALESARLYAESCGMHEAVASLARRIDKIHEARVREIAG